MMRPSLGLFLRLSLLVLVSVSAQANASGGRSLCLPQPNALLYRYGMPGKVKLAFPQEVAGSYMEDGAHRAGVRVTLADGREREFRCKGRIDSRLADLKSTLRCDGDNALNGGACP